MSQTYSLSESTSFTITDAKKLASKVATDLKRMQRFYRGPSDVDIAKYEAEVIALLNDGYLGKIIYGFKRNGNWIAPTLQYTARDLVGAAANDDDPGSIRPGADITNASFYSYLTYSAAWFKLSPSKKDAFKESHPVKRTGADEPGVDGYFSNDRIYSSGGRAIDRASLRSYG